MFLCTEHQSTNINRLERREYKRKLSKESRKILKIFAEIENDYEH